MGHNWIIGVLADLESFAQKNDLPMLADQIGQAAVVATAELTPLTEGASVGMLCDGDEIRSVPKGTRSSNAA